MKKEKERERKKKEKRKKEKRKKEGKTTVTKKKKKKKKPRLSVPVAFLYMANIYIRKCRNTDTMFSKHRYSVFETQLQCIRNTNTVYPKHRYKHALEPTLVSPTPHLVCHAQSTVQVRHTLPM